MKKKLEYGTGFDELDDVSSLSGDEVMRRLLDKAAYDHLQELVLHDDLEEPIPPLMTPAWAILSRLWVP